VKITELFSLEELELELQDGFVVERKHPTLPLTILNYTDRTTYEQRWNAVTMHCRGLIVNHATNEVVARGPRKFFNYGEPSATEYPLDTQVRLTRKEDGSLGIIWGYGMLNEEAHWGYATRGSFTSEQAVHATANMHEVIPDSIHQWQARNTTSIDEIVYPANRIVLDYGGLDENIPLGEVDNKSGLIIWRPSSALVPAWSAIMTLAEALALPIPDDEEGYVLDILDEYLNVVDHLKLKGARYKELHAAIFGLTERRLYDLWVQGVESTYIEDLPDEVQPWALAVVQRFDLDWAVLRAEVRSAFSNFPQGSRKELAQYIMANHKHLSAALFALLDSDAEKCHSWIDKQIKPGHVPFSSLTSEKLANNKTLESASI